MKAGTSASKERLEGPGGWERDGMGWGESLGAAVVDQAGFLRKLTTQYLHHIQQE